MLASADVLAEERLDFAADIQPILSDRCYTCHGPDAGQRATDLRLDQRDSAHELAIKAGDPEGSELIRRITSSDADEVMPPADSNLQLSEHEKRLLRKWIESGGEYSEHWAFVSPQLPEIPQVKQADWPRNDLDRFVLHRLEQLQLVPAEEADAETLLRRLTLDLTGLPPTIDEIDHFLTEYQLQPAVAYERIVDRLLASRRYGERMAIDWLDAARYADTYGYQNDRYRPMWPWRDWVVQAFNDNLPYDDFLTWQIAGDLLPNATRDQILATAFNRNHRQTNEGGSVDEEFRSEYVADRVNTFGAAVLGLTLECCRCHDHKYDPLTQREYYQLSAFFNSIDESGLYSHFTEATPTPTLLLADESQSEALAELDRRVASSQQRLENWRPRPEDFTAWQAGPVTLRHQLEQALLTDLIGDFPLDELEKDKLVNRVDGSLSGKTSEEPKPVVGKVAGGLLLSGENNVSVKPGGDFTRNQPFTISLWVKAAQHMERGVVFHRSRAWTDAGSRGYELLIEQGRLSAALIHFWPGNALRVISRDKLPVGRWVHVSVRYDGSSRAFGLQLFVDGQSVDVEIVRDSLTKHIRGNDGADGGDVDELTLGQRFRDVGFKQGSVDELKIFQRDLSDLEIRYLFLRDAAPANLAEFLHNVSQPEMLDFFGRRSGERAELTAAIRSLRDQRSRLGDKLPEIMVMREEPKPRATFVLMRGAYDAPGELVQRGLPAAILPTAVEPTANRLDLARWLVDPRHPLTSRVAVNRLWQSLFGVGLVSTAEDFGLQGTPPSHPELLDWLSVELVESGWDIKKLLKTIVLSATYRQSSNPTRRLLELDPENRLLARGPTIRLPAEMIRDAALSVGGLLVEKSGGAPVKPYQPDGLWEEKSGLAYNRDAGEGSHRRSLYTYWKRTSPPPAMMTLDASNREVCVVRRQVTMTPLQALVLLNDPQYVEAARGLAERTLLASDKDPRRAEFLFRCVTGRRPSEQEKSVVLTMVREQQQWFEQSQQAVSQWLSIGDHQSDSRLEPIELAAWAVAAGGLLSLDATIMKR